MIGARRETSVPIYEYACRSCSHRFELIVDGSRRPACPSCGATRLEKQLSVFAVGAGQGRDSPGERPCGTCGDPRGPGACSLDN